MSHPLVLSMVALIQDIWIIQHVLRNVVNSTAEPAAIGCNLYNTVSIVGQPSPLKTSGI